MKRLLFALLGALAFATPALEPLIQPVGFQTFSWKE